MEGERQAEEHYTSGGAPSGFAAHETLVLAFLWGASEMKNFGTNFQPCKNNGLCVS